MATYRTSATGGGTTGTGNRTMTISAVAGDHLTVYVKWSANNATNPTCTDNQSGTYDLVLTALNNASADIMAIFVRQQQVQTTATLTISPVVGSGTNTAGQIVTVAVTGMTRMGANSIRQSAKQENQTSGVPTPVLGASALTGNLTVTVAGSTTTAGAVPNASWTERQDASQSSPVTAIEVATRDSGFTGTSAAYVSIASAVWSSAILEFDTTVPNFFDKETWPIPEGHKVGTRGQPATSLKTWTDTTKLNLRGQDRFFYGPGRGPRYDYPNPRGPQRSIDLITWSENLLQSTLTPAVNRLPRSPLYTKREPPVHPISLRTWDQGNLAGLRGQVQAPLRPAEWSNPRPLPPNLDLGTWTSQTKINLIGQDQLPALNRDWPNPSGAAYPMGLRVWSNPATQAAVISHILRSPLLVQRGQINPALVDVVQNLLATTLGQAQVDPLRPPEWPNPRGAAGSIDLRTWVESTLNLIGQDTLPFPNRDWPNPKGYTPPALTWTDPTKIQLIGQDRLPFPNRDWPNPWGRTPAIDLKTWAENITRLIGKDSLPSLNRDWPNPRGYTPIYPSWIDRTRIQLIGQDQLPFPNRDWPNPRGSLLPIDLRTWTETTLYLLGQDTFFGLAGHPTFDWPNPRGPYHPLHPSTVSLLGTLLAAAQSPFYPLDWPNPLGKIPAIDLRTWIESTLHLLGQDRLPENQFDWSNPRGALFPVSLLAPDQIDLLNTLLATLAGTPFNMTAWPNPRGAAFNQPLIVPGNPNLLPPTPPTPDQLRQIIRFAPLAGGRTHWTR